MGSLPAGLTCALLATACSGTRIGSTPNEGLSGASSGDGGASTGDQGAVAAPCPDPVELPDPVVRAAVQASSGTDLAQLLVLDLREPVASLAGVECLRGLKYLSLARGGSLVDLSPVAGLSELDALSLVGPFPDLSDVSPLASLSKLTYLRVSQAAVSDISALGSLKNLTSLFLSNNRIDDISSLAALTKLTSELQLDNNQISDLAPLAPLKGISFLKLSSNSISDLTPLADSFCLGPADPVKSSFCSIDARENPLDCAAQAANIATLQTRGDIFTDCP